MKKNKKGFTIIELLVMVTLLLIILGLMVPNFLAYINNSDRSKYDTLKKNIESSAAIYVDNEGGFSKVGPITIGKLVEEGFLNEKSRKELDNYVDSGLAGSATTYEQNICIDEVNKKVVYHITGYQDLSGGNCNEKE